MTQTKYNVRVRSTFTTMVTVEAEDPRQAARKAVQAVVASRGPYDNHFMPEVVDMQDDNRIIERIEY